MLKDKFKSAKDAVSKSLIISKVLLKKVLKLLLHHQIFSLGLTFLLMPLLNSYSIEEQDGKKDLIWLISYGGLKMIFTLLAETIAV